MDRLSGRQAALDARQDSIAGLSQAARRAGIDPTDLPLAAAAPDAIPDVNGDNENDLPADSEVDKDPQKTSSIAPVRAGALPFVFAVMVMGPQAVGKGLPARVRAATQKGLDSASAIARSYNSGVDAARAEHYLRHVIRYDLGEREKEGLALFHRLAQARGLLDHAKELEFDAI